MTRDDINMSEDIDLINEALLFVGVKHDDIIVVVLMLICALSIVGYLWVRKIQKCSGLDCKSIKDIIDSVKKQEEDIASIIIILDSNESAEKELFDGVDTKLERIEDYLDSIREGSAHIHGVLLGQQSSIYMEIKHDRK